MPSSIRDFSLVGVTGGIGSGKSTVTKIFKQLGRETLSADEIAKVLMVESAPLREAIIARFGKESYLPDRSLNRAMLASTIFASTRQRKALERLVHPPTLAAIQRMVGALTPQQRRPYVIVEAALIYEVGFDKDLDRVIVVDAEEQIRVQRIMRRDHLSAEQIARRMESQMSSEEKTRRADFVIQNDGGVEELRARIVFLDNLLQHMVSS